MADVTDDILRRVPPQNLEAEQSVLGAILLDNDASNQAIEILSPDDFYRDAHREIFRAMIELADRNQPVDAITLTDMLRSQGALEAVGGPGYVAELAAAVPTAANVAHYARIVREKALLRNLVRTCTDILTESYEAPSNVDEFLDGAEHRIFEISERRIRPSFHSMPELTKQAIQILERLYERKELVTGVPTGFIDLDRITAGFQPSDLIIIAARPSMGKTALALNIMAHAALDADPPIGVAFFSLEMSKEQLVLRL
ncbi:MAG TPA: replicative DNA helicase, partial [Candidatus Binataceae bacterium]